MQTANKEDKEELELYKDILNDILEERNLGVWDSINNGNKKDIISEINDLVDDTMGFEDRYYVLIYTIDNENKVQMMAVSKSKLDI